MKQKRSVNAKSDALTTERVFVSFIFVLEIILVFTFIDYVVHSMSPDYAVPSYYFTNKIIYGTLIGTITYLFIRKKPALQKSLLLSAVVAVLLQIRYLITGYPLSFVISFLFIHFAILFLVSYLGMKLTKM